MTNWTVTDEKGARCRIVLEQAQRKPYVCYFRGLPAGEFHTLRAAMLSFAPTVNETKWVKHESN